MKLILALRGKGGSGKSSTIRILHNLLEQNRFTIVESNFKPHKSDFTAIFSRGDKLIGVTSTGDTYDLVHKWLKKLVDAKCNICICACRTFDKNIRGTNAAIREFADYANEFIEKSIAPDIKSQNLINTKDAEKLLIRIQKLIPN